MKTTSLLHSTLLGAAMVLMAASTSQAALVLDFSSPTYSVGELNGQDTAQSGGSGGEAGWFYEPGGYVVNATAGVGGGAGVLTTPAAAYHSLRFLPNLSFLSGFNGASSIVDFSVDYRYTQLPTGGWEEAGSVHFGFTNASYISAVDSSAVFMANNGNLVINGAGSAYNVTDTTTWTTLSARLNYGTQKYTLFVNGTQIGASGMAFKSASAVAGFEFETAPGSYTMAFDNLSVSVVPEPTTIVMMLGGVGMLVLFRRRRA